MGKSTTLKLLDRMLLQRKIPFIRLNIDELRKEIIAQSILHPSSNNLLQELDLGSSQAANFRLRLAISSASGDLLALAYENEINRQLNQLVLKLSTKFAGYTFLIEDALISQRGLLGNLEGHLLHLYSNTSLPYWRRLDCDLPANVLDYRINNQPSTEKLYQQIKAITTLTQSQHLNAHDAAKYIEQSHFLRGNLG